MGKKPRAQKVQKQKRKILIVAKKGQYRIVVFHPRKGQQIALGHFLVAAEFEDRIDWTDERDRATRWTLEQITALRARLSELFCFEGVIDEDHGVVHAGEHLAMARVITWQQHISHLRAAKGL
jgi:hypothetical protein